MSLAAFRESKGDVLTVSINLPQAAVLGMHTIKEKPVVVDGQIVIRPIMVVALTYDHRLLDGREAVTFLGELPVFFLFLSNCRVDRTFGFHELDWFKG